MGRVLYADSKDALNINKNFAVFVLYGYFLYILEDIWINPRNSVLITDNLMQFDDLKLPLMLQILIEQ